MSLCADDTVLYYSSNNLDQAMNEVQNDLAALSNWCDINKLTINYKKKPKYCVYGMRKIVKKKEQKCRYDSIPEQRIIGKSLFI